MLLTNQISIKRGILFILLAMMLFSFLNAIIKDSTNHYNPIQIAFFTCFFSTLFPASMLFLRREWNQISVEKWKIHLKRTFLLATGLSLLFLGMGRLPLSTSMALYFSSTLFLVIVSYPILKEKVSFIQWMAVGLGFIGVLIVVNPAGEIFNCGAIFMILGAVMESAYNLYGRYLSLTISIYMLTFLGTFLPSFVLLIFLPFVWIPPDFEGWTFLIFLGLGSGIAQLCVALAYKHAPAGVLSPMIYSAMIWSVILDIYHYGNWPNKSLLVGCGIIIISGLIIVLYKRKSNNKQSFTSNKLLTHDEHGYKGFT